MLHGVKIFRVSEAVLLAKVFADSDHYRESILKSRLSQELHVEKTRITHRTRGIEVNRVLTGERGERGERGGAHW